MYNIEVIKGGDVVEINVPDSTFNTEDTSLTLIGRDAVSYGEALNENMLKLLSNSAGPTEPNQPLVGELWFNTLDQKIYLNSIKGFSILGSAVWSPNQPSIESSNVGDLWVKSTTRQLYVFGGDAYTLIGPAYDTRNGVTAIVDQVVNDVSGIGHIIGIVKVADNELGFFSNEPFSYPGYGEVVRGFNPLGGSFTINASILSAKNLERGSEVIPASDIAVKGENANFAVLEATAIETQNLLLGTINVENVSGNIVIDARLKVNSLEVGSASIESNGSTIEVTGLGSNTVTSQVVSTASLTSDTNITVQKALILDYEQASPSSELYAAAPKKYVNDSIATVAARPITLTMHTPALDIATLQGAIVQYLNKLLPTNTYPVSTIVRVLAVQTQVKNKLLVSDYASAAVHIYELKESGWEYVHSEE